MLVEVFKTSIQCNATAVKVEQALLNKFPQLKINFDLDDCDRILRIEAVTIQVTEVINTLRLMDIVCERLL